MNELEFYLNNGIQENALTERELDVKKLLEEGYSNRSIGEALNVGLPTVKQYVVTLLEKYQYLSRYMFLTPLEGTVELPNVSYSTREHSIIYDVLAGASSHESARSINCSERGIRSARVNILRKTRTALEEEGICDLDPGTLYLIAELNLRLNSSLQKENTLTESSSTDSG